MAFESKLDAKLDVKEIQCQRLEYDDHKSETPRSARVGIFNAEDFLSRAQMNDKINNILRSPTKAPNRVRQRSIYTNNPSPSTIRCVSSLPHMCNYEHTNSRLNTTVSSNTSLMNKEYSNQTIDRNFMPLEMHISRSHPQFSTPSMHKYDAEEIAIGGNVMSLGTNGLSNHYATPTEVSYNYENDTGYILQPKPHPHIQQFPSPMPPPPIELARVSSRTVDFENPTLLPCPGSGPIAMSNGTIQLRLRDGVRIDMTLDKAVRVFNLRSMVAIALSRNCSNSAMIHPNGRILQNGSKVEIVTYDGMKNNNFVRYAKMWYKGVSFTSESCALIYLVDTAGTRTTTDTFTDLSKDYTLAVFYDDSRHGPSCIQDVYDAINNSTYNCSEDGTEVYDINGFHITQAPDGLVKLSRHHNKCIIRTSPGNGSATLTTPGIHCTASLGKTSHLFVRRNEKRMHFDGSCFVVRNAGHSAGFNETNLLIVY